jgi:hypothetical protein
VIWEAIDAAEATDYDQQLAAQTTSQNQPSRTQASARNHRVRIRRIRNIILTEESERLIDPRQLAGDFLINLL